MGVFFHVQPMPVTVRDQEVNHEGLLVDIKQGEDSLGIWLLSRSLSRPQRVRVQNKDYYMSLRPKRYHLPFRMTLKKFTHDVYPQTDIPKNFSSLVEIEDENRGERRNVLIYMNHPLRYRGKTYFQASYGKNNTQSILQVVENPVWLFPYISCLVIALGLVVHFMLRLFKFSRKL